MTRSKAKLTALSRKDHLTFLGFIAPNFILFAVFTFWPLIYSLYLSFMRWNMISPNKTWVGFENYILLSKDPVFWLAVKNTVYVTAGTVIIKLAIALFLAVLLNQKLAGRLLYRAVIFSPTFTTSVAVAMVWTWIFDPFYGILRYPIEALGLVSPNWLGDVNWTVPALIIVSIWQGLGYDMVIFLAGLQSIPKILYEAAEVDGASKSSSFFNITLPLLSPTTFFLIITSIISSFKTFDLVAVMTQGGPLNSSNVYIYYLYQLAFKRFRMGAASAMSVIFFVVILMITVIQVRISKKWVHY
ncbi:MAG: sugar ABC transporter permease [Anaerolineaceae bacterium]|nr:sugar ABC transporter permease [Anaerolineaceae bacterium]